MKKRILALAALLILALAMSVQAAEQRAAAPKPRLAFSGTTANCSVRYICDSSSDEVEATLTLYQGATYVDAWSGSGTGTVSVSGSCRVTSGKSYKLVLEYSVNGSAKPSVSATGVCP